MDAKVVGILRDLVAVEDIDVAFLINGTGHVLVSVGSSGAFSHNGEFTDPGELANDNPDTSLYMTAVTKGIYLGILFAAEVPIDSVRTAIAEHEGDLASAITG